MGVKVDPEAPVIPDRSGGAVGRERLIRALNDWNESFYCVTTAPCRRQQIEIPFGELGSR
jgi:hypothetical protein